MNSSPVHFEKPSRQPDDLYEVLSSLDLHSKLAEAVELARSGNYGDAEEILKTIKDWQSIPPVLDLMARIDAQQGKLDDASKHWKEAIKLSPSNLSYQSGLEYITKLKRPRSVAAQLFIWFSRGMGILILGVFFSLALKQLTTKQTPQIPDNGQIATLQAQVLGLYSTPSVPTLSSSPIPTYTLEPTSVSSNNDLQEIGINVTGLKTIPYDNALIVYPENDMFQYSWSFSPGAQEMVTELGNQLEPYSGKIVITLIGFTDNSEKSGLFDIGLTRSNVIFSLMQRSTKLPADIF